MNLKLYYMNFVKILISLSLLFYFVNANNYVNCKINQNWKETILNFCNNLHCHIEYKPEKYTESIKNNSTEIYKLYIISNIFYNGCEIVKNFYK